MDNQRLFLFVALSLVIMMLYNAWQEQFAPRQPVPATASGEKAPAAPQDLPSALPSTTTPSSAEVPAETPAASAAAAIASHQRVHVKTDLLDVDIDTTGGDIRRVALLTYPQHLNTPDQPVLLLDDRLPHLFIAQSGLLSSTGQSVDHHAVFTTGQTDYTLAAGDKDLQVVLRWQGDNGLSVTKTYTFHRDSYVIDMNVTVNNATAQEWSGRLYCQLQRTDVTDTD